MSSSGDGGEGNAGNGNTTGGQASDAPTVTVWYHELAASQDEDDASDDQYEPSESNNDDEFMDAPEEIDEDDELDDFGDGAEWHRLMNGEDEEEEDEDEDEDEDDEDEGEDGDENQEEGAGDDTQQAVDEGTELLLSLLDAARGAPYTRDQVLEFLRRSNMRAIVQHMDGGRGGFDTPWNRIARLRRRPPKDPNRFPKVPSVEGTKLMQSGLFGTTDVEYNYNRRMKKSIQRRLLERELGLGSYDERWRNNDLIAQALKPSTKADQIIHYEDPVYSGQFSDDGNFFFSCGQDFKVRLYDTSSPYNWKHYKTVSYPWGRWTLTDASLSRDNKWLAYTSITSLVSIAPTDPNDSGDPYSLDLSDGGANNNEYWGGGFGGIWSIRFSGDGRELVAGTNRNAIVVYDIESRRVLHQVQGHDDDVNAVCFADKSSPHIIYSGSDDSTLKVWDRRSMGDSREAGVFLGHSEGLTYIDSKGDGRYILSNGKDQSMKLWDLRMMMSTDRFRSLDPASIARFSGYDYRSGRYDEDDWDAHPHDNSVVTFRGHKVLNTLIRCHFSPPNSTNSRYVYSGSSDGKVYVYNLDATIATVINVREATKHSRPAESWHNRRRWSTCVRDASWHPHAPILVASAWNGTDLSNGTCTLHSFNEGDDDEGEPRMTQNLDETLQPIALHERDLFENDI